MPRIIETTVYTIDELSGAAKENARIWYRRHGLHDDWYDFVYEDFETICRILGVTLATSPVCLYGNHMKVRIKTVNILMAERPIRPNTVYSNLFSLSLIKPLISETSSRVARCSICASIRANRSP